jgi:hypothetical protein
MYAVRICIYPDGDFGFDEPEFNIELEIEQIFYFEERKEAAESIIRSFHNLRNSFRTHGWDEIKRWVDSFDDRIELIVKKINTFVIDKDFGNQQITYELAEVDKKYLPNGSYTYIKKEPEIDFSWYREETIKWDEVITWEDIEKEEEGNYGY